MLAFGDIFVFLIGRLLDMAGYRKQENHSELPEITDHSTLKNSFPIVLMAKDFLSGHAKDVFFPCKYLHL